MNPIKLSRTSRKIPTTTLKRMNTMRNMKKMMKKKTRRKPMRKTTMIAKIVHVKMVQAKMMSLAKIVMKKIKLLLQKETNPKLSKSLL